MISGRCTGLRFANDRQPPRFHQSQGATTIVKTKTVRGEDAKARGVFRRSIEWHDMFEPPLTPAARLHIGRMLREITPHAARLESDFASLTRAAGRESGDGLAADSV